MTAKAQPLKIEEGLYVICAANEATHIRLKLPVNFQPLKERIISVQTIGARQNTPNWSWNGSVDKPTLRPSVLTRWEGGEPSIKHVCHSFITDGKIHFLEDCTHDLAGMIKDLEEV